jgi:hypothetical protein
MHLDVLILPERGESFYGFPTNFQYEGVQSANHKSILAFVYALSN